MSQSKLPPASTRAQQREESEALDDQAVNPRANTEPGLMQKLSRRRLLQGGVALAAIGFLGSRMLGDDSPLPGPVAPRSALLGFEGVPTQHDPLFDRVIVPAGYVAEAFFSWGDAVDENAEDWQADASNRWDAQLMQAGQNHDGMHFFAFDGEEGRGLLVVNHEYTNETLHPAGASFIDGRRPLEEVKKEQAAHGVSVIELARADDARWQRVFPSRFNRRVSAMTPMAISGPLAGDPRMKTVADATGRAVFGTINNCSSGKTPWGTYLICEENWHHYFANADADDYAKRPTHQRYGITQGDQAKMYAWNTADARFDATPQAGQPHQGYVNEPNRFGWVVELDPFDPDSTPVKRTTFGRFCREGVGMALAENGQMAYYSGDDTRGEYIYKFVPSHRYSADEDAHGNNWLDVGILYVARFDDDGRGVWLPLVHGENGLTAEHGFTDQGDILLNTRGAADILGATPMDRPEWATVHPHSREVFVTLTNNKHRGKKFPLNAANPRPDNRHGQIVRLREAQNDPAAISFEWELFLLAGEPDGATDVEGKAVAEHLKGNINGDHFSSPDGLGIDDAGRVWILTDYDDATDVMVNMGCNQVLCADPDTREVRRFLVGPRGCEMTGITWSPDHRTLWVNVQHPELSYPASDGKTRPRSTTVMVRREDGGVIGA